MKKLVLILASIPLMLSAGLWPQNVVAELATATWCGYCPQAYAGLEVMKTNYPIPDLVCVRYYSTSSGGQYGSAEIDSRISYYSVTGYPTCVFNGTEKVVGGGAQTSDGSRYDPVVSTLLTLGTPFGLKVQMNIVGSTAIVTTTVHLYGNYSGTTPRLIVALTEDEVTSEYTNLTRRVVNAGDVTVKNEGQEQTIEQEFDIDASWDKDNLHAVAIIQNNTTKEVLQAASSYTSPNYHYRLTAPSRVSRVAPTETSTSTFYLTNMGSKSDNFTLTLDNSKLPAGWSATLTSPASMASINLASEEGAEFTLEIEPNGKTGQGNVTVKVSSASGGVEQDLIFTAITNDVDVNIIDDDGNEDFEKYFTAALTSIGKTYGVWDIGMGDFNLSNLASDKTPVLIWSCGWSFPSLTKTDRDFLKYYLGTGGKLFLTGQDIGWDLYDAGSADADYDSKQFYNNYLHAKYVADSAASVVVAGVSADPISNGMSFNIAGGDGANNQVYPDAVDAYDASATSFLKYGTNQSAGIRVAKDKYKIVYLGFGFEGVDNATARKNLLQKSLAWLGDAEPITGIAEDAQPTTLNLKIETIASHSLSISYSVPSAEARIDVYDILGRRVTSTTLSTESGDARIDMSGLPRGCYFVRLSSGNLSKSAKVVLLP